MKNSLIGGRPIIRLYVKFWAKLTPVLSKTPIFNWFSVVTPRP